MKRLIDVMGASLALLCLSPLLFWLSLRIRSDMGSPVFFLQDRIGEGGRIFRMIKFRSMRETLDANGVPLPDGERLTAFGQKLRASSVDELPELWNVLKGEMSLVGPRPVLVEYLSLYSKEQARRHEIRPGLTGWAQVNGRNSISWEEKFALDVWYVDNQTLWLDFKIILITLKKVLGRTGVSAEGSATMVKFDGKMKNGRR